MYLRGKGFHTSGCEGRTVLATEAKKVEEEITEEKGWGEKGTDKEQQKVSFGV